MGVTPDRGYQLALFPKERAELAARPRDPEILPRQDGQAKVGGPPFRDRELEMALEYLRRQVSKS